MFDHFEYHTLLKGSAGSRQRIITPGLILDLDVFERNNRILIEYLDAHGMSLRANAKTHKCSEIARRQVAAGATGVCCATIGEAQRMTAAGISGILLTTPVSGKEKASAVASLASRSRGFLTVVDDAEHVRLLAAGAKEQEIVLPVLVDIDAGSHRTGVPTLREAIELGKLVDSQPHLKFSGLQCYAGSVQHIPNSRRRREANDKVLDWLETIVNAAKSAGLNCEVVSGGGTGSYRFDAEHGVLTESQAGSFAFMDTDYLDVWLADGLTPPFEASLFVQTAVHSARHDKFVTTDAGSKRFGSDGSMPRIAGELADCAEYVFHGDEHGRVIAKARGIHLKIGDRLECQVPHCDPTINLYDYIYCVREDTVVDIWKVDARGI